MANVTRSAGGSQRGHPQSTDRRNFFKWIGAGVGTAAFASTAMAQVPFDNIPFPFDTGTDAPITLDFSNDFGVVNYAFLLEQLEAAFFAMAVAQPYDGITDEERKVLRDLRNHEIIHREFYRVGIPALGGMAIPAVRFDFSAVDFTSRESVLTTSRIFEDLGVAAYNGAGPLINDPDILLVAGKIVSVEARHAAAVRDLLRPVSPFSGGEGDSPELDGRDPGAAGEDVVDENGLDRAFHPDVVLAAAAPFLVNPVNVMNLPTSEEVFGM